MQLVSTRIELIPERTREDIYRKLELCGRVAYKSEERITEDSAIPFIRNLIKRGHESVLEHVSITLRLVTDRATANAWVRHRIAAYTQESTIYCDYGKAGEIAVRTPFFLEPESEAWWVWMNAMTQAEEAYNKLRSLGLPPGQARDVLPSALKTELIATHNLREWRHIIRARMVPGDSAGMHLLIGKVLFVLSHYLPVCFEDILPTSAVGKANMQEIEYGR